MVPRRIACLAVALACVSTPMSAGAGAGIASRGGVLAARAKAQWNRARMAVWRKTRTWQRIRGGRIVATAAGPVEVSLRGEGPAVLLIHGTPGDHKQGMSLADYLDVPGFGYIAPSRPGYLRTPESVGATPEQQADAYAALLDSLGVEKAAVLAVSGGGPSALMFAARYPERVSGLALMGAVTHASPRPADPPPESVGYEWYTASKKDRTHATRTFVVDKRLQNMILADPKGAALMHAMLNSMFPFSANSPGWKHDLAQFPRIDLPLESLKTPVLIMHGTDDHNEPYLHALLASRRIPGARLETFKDFDHFFLVEDPARTRSVLTQFLTEHAGTPLRSRR